MKALKIIGKVLLIVFIVFLVLMTLFFMFARDGYGVELLKGVFADGFFQGIKNFFVETWNGIKYVFGA